MSLDEATRQRIDELTSEREVLLFMKGTRQAPQCGFSASVVRILDRYLPDYETVDVLSDQAIREGIKLYSSWPTIPQLYVKGEFVGGCDILQELAAKGELFETLGVERPAPCTPAIEVAPATAAALREAAERHGASGQNLHLEIDARYRGALAMAPAAENEIEVWVGVEGGVEGGGVEGGSGEEGVALRLDPLSASRADGATIELVETAGGQGFRITHPKAPRVQSMSVGELRAALDAGSAKLLLDVRPPEEREQACIERSRCLDEEEARRVEALPRDTRLVFICHHGMRSQAAAEHFAAMGFGDVHSVEGGIDAWSQQIDPSVPRY